MANENMEEYRTGPAIIDETVRVAKKYLEEHPEEKMNLSAVDERLRSKNYPIGAKVIRAFLNWPESRVGYSHGGQP